MRYIMSKESGDNNEGNLFVGGVAGYVLRF